MAVTKRQVITGLSVIYLAALTLLAAYALHSTNVYSLPIANVVSALTVALPPLAGVALETVLSLNESLATKGQLQTSRIFQIVVAVFLVFETVLATIAGTHVAPAGSLNCALREKWQHLWQSKDGTSLQRIQDAFNCCGLKSAQDMAYPFPDATHHADACIVRYDRHSACMEPWRDEERKVAIMLLVVPVAVFIWKVAILLAPSSQSSWLPSQVRLPHSDPHESPIARRLPRPALGYRDLEEQGEEDSLHREVNNLNKDSQLATHVERNRSRGSQLWTEAEQWRESNSSA